MKKSILQRISFQIALITFGFSVFPGCAKADPETLPGNDFSVHTTEQNEFQIKPRKNYISPETETKRLMQLAHSMMRVPNLGLTRTFFTTKDEKDAAFSIGDTRDGYLINGKSLPMPSLLLRQLPVQYERGIIYGTNELIALLTDTARAMQKKYPKTILYLGNMGAREGGDIPYSISHNAGRDADIAFYMLDSNTKFAHPDNLYKINRRLTSGGGQYTFDLEKNTTLVETLLTHPKIHVQFIFLAKHLRSAIQRELIARNASPDLLARFEQSVQNQSSHDDHFHIRIYCSNEDICAGCMDRSITHPWHEDPLPKREKCIQKHAAAVSSSKTPPDKKAAALQRLALLGAAPEHAQAIVKNLSHKDQNVRAAAAIAARSLSGTGDEALARQYDKETNPDVKLEILRSLASSKSLHARQIFHRELTAAPYALTPQQAAIIADFILHYPDSADAQPVLTAALARPQDNALWMQTFEIVANLPACKDDIAACLQNYQAWLAQSGSKPRQTWLINGFRSAGFKVSKLDNADIPILLDALDGPRAISINAQILLRQLGRIEQDSLNWPIQDAKWHYTRYFKRRAKKYKIDLSDRDERGNKI